MYCRCDNRMGVLGPIPQGLAGMDGLGSKLKKLVKTGVKVAAVAATAMYAPSALPAVAGMVIKPKEVPPDPLLTAPVVQVPAPLPSATATTLAPPSLPPMTAPLQPINPQVSPAFLQLPPSMPQQGEGVPKWAIYGGIGLLSVVGLALVLRR